MNTPNFDVVIVGAGAAGLTAAIGLSRAGFAVAAVEAAAYPGAENWSGCVYFTENLAHPDILGPEGVEELAWERRLVERGFFATDGHSLLGMSYRDPPAFKNCYTVLRPIYDLHLAQFALRHGVHILSETTVESLIRDGTKVIGVCTDRGPIYARLVFLAEGDASHLVTKEGYERYSDQREAPKFLQGIKQVIDMPAGAIEETFGVGAEEGVAYEMLLRNGTLRGQRVHLNMGGFLYTNRQSLSVGLVLPADNLHDHFEGDPNLLLEWFENLPALQPWLQRGQQGVFGAKIIRGGGAHDIPTLIDEGLAIGGAASAIGIDFPYPNFTGPATGMGLLIVQAAKRIRDEKGEFTRENLRRHYLEPLQQTNYWQDVEFLRRWPAYVKRTTVFFGRNLDLALGTAFVWTRPKRWFLTKWMNWMRFLLYVGGPVHWGEMRHDIRHIIRALRLGEVTDRPALGRLLLDGTINALRDLFGKPRPDLPPAGKLRLHYSVGGGNVPTERPPRPLLRWFRRFAPILAAAARRVYTNDAVPLFDKLPVTFRGLFRQMNIFDIWIAGVLGLATLVCTTLIAAYDRVMGRIFRKANHKPSRGLYGRYAEAAARAGDMTPATLGATQKWEARLAGLSYQTGPASHIHVLWPKSIADKDSLAGKGLWHVCPAHVYEARVSPLGQLQVIVNFENCIKCETCWRTSDLVDWGRDGQQRFIYPVHSPVVGRLWEAVEAAGAAKPAPALSLLGWRTHSVQPSVVTGESTAVLATNGQQRQWVAQARELLLRLDRKLQEFDEALAEEPRTVDQSRAEYLEMLARYAQQLAEKFQEIERENHDIDLARPGDADAFRLIREMTTPLVAKAQERARRTWNQKYAWAAAEGRQLRWHHLAGIRHGLEQIDPEGASHPRMPDPLDPWSRTEEDALADGPIWSSWRHRLDNAFPSAIWRDLDNEIPLTSEQDAVLRDLLGQVPRLDPADLTATLHPPLRKALLADLGRRDPSLAYRAASHLWARDLVRLTAPSSSLAQAAMSFTQGDEWACFSVVDGVIQESSWKGEAWCVPGQAAKQILLLLQDRLVLISRENPGVRLEPLKTLGLRGAGLARIVLEGPVLPESSVVVDRQRILRVWHIISSADLTSIAFGMADQLCRRAIAHACSRVQFPGLFLDETARDSIGKFGAVKKMIAEMAARRYLIETLDHTLSPADFSSTALDRARLIIGLVAELLGTSPGSISYNAGQIFGGTGYSEDDILSKFYRDAAAWRFLGLANAEAFSGHGQELLRDWRDDGSRLAGVDNEIELFETVIQRKALQRELDEVRNTRSRLRNVVNKLGARLPAMSVPGAADRDNRREGQGRQHLNGKQVSGGGLAEIQEALARQDAQLLASKALILRTHARLEHGWNTEVEIALVRVWLDEVGVSVLEFENLVSRQLDQAGKREDHPVVEMGAGPPVTTYADYLKAPSPYQTGDFLAEPVNLLQSRFCVDMIQSDPALASRDREIKDLLTGYFGPLRDGLIYERYIERKHLPDPEDLEFCRLHGFFRMPIPKDLGGEGLLKVDYYLLTTNAQRLVDVAISLAIQASTSIGATPVFLAQAKDLPKARKDLKAFMDDKAAYQEVLNQLNSLTKNADALSEAEALERIKKLHPRVDETVLRRPVLKNLMREFAECWQKLKSQERPLNREILQSLLQAGITAWKEGWEGAEDYFDELSRRGEACALFCRWVASGQISAFALTEPSAGSDTARVATRARLCSVPVDNDGEGVYRFLPARGNEPRFLLDARRVVFPDRKPAYQWSELEAPAPIHFDDYDYETDDSAKARYVVINGRRVNFTDIAQLRERDGRLWYDYWEMTGAKMWITNGRICGIMALYAKTDAGVTGFIVDRHAEGLVVGKDEAKMGQLGSPTNELSLQAVRVPRENVLGIEGRGQVNALETLNVGRAGIAMSAVAQMEGIIESSRAYARKNHGDLPEWARWRLDRMEESRFIAEAFAYEVIGRLEHPQTKSVVMETAISKMMASELLHLIIELAEQIHGLPGQTEKYLVEKRKRDARILNIYEGTNEIQRFVILKDLVTDVIPRSLKGSGTPTHSSQEALELETLKESLRRQLRAAMEFFGQSLWQNPNLQANCFLAAEAAAWLKAADSVLARVAWLTRYDLLAGGQWGGGGDAAYTRASGMPSVELGRRALCRCFDEIRRRLRRFDEELTHLRRGFYAPGVRAAALLFGRDQSVHDFRPTSDIGRPLRILVIVDPLHTPAPHPYVQNGQLREGHLTPSSADRAALEMAWRLREQAGAPVTIQVVGVGPKAAVQSLHEALYLGADRVRHIITQTQALAPDSSAKAITAALGTAGGEFDLILGGTAGKEGEEGLVAQLASQEWGIRLAGTAGQIAVNHNDQDSAVLLWETAKGNKVRSLPALVLIKAGLPLRNFTVAGYLQGLAKGIELIRWPKKVSARPITFSPGDQAALLGGIGGAPAGDETHGDGLSPGKAAEQVLREMGLGGARVAMVPYSGPIEKVSLPNLAERSDSSKIVIAILAAAGDGHLHPSAKPTIKAAHVLAGCLGSAPTVLLLAPPEEEAQRQATGELLTFYQGDIILLSTPSGAGSPDLLNRLLQESLPLLDHSPAVVIGESWSEEALGALGIRGRQPALVAARVRDVAGTPGGFIADGARAEGRLISRLPIAWNETASYWISLAQGAEISAETTSVTEAPVRVRQWSPRLERWFGQADIQRLLVELKQETGVLTLADAEFIVDVGYGVGNQDGYEEVIDPLVKALQGLGVVQMMVGGSRKVTEELHLLPVDRQIGQSGVSVNPKILLAIGISGAPQHLSYIGPKATIVAFNQDPEAPLMVLNQRQAKPRVFPVLGDLFETVPAFTAGLRGFVKVPDSKRDFALSRK